MKNLHIFFKAKFLIFLVLGYFLFNGAIIFCKNNSSAITYVLNRGRFGDHLLNYCKAKWISYKYDIPFFYVPFKYSDRLKIGDIENVCHSGLERNFKRKFRFEKKTDVKVDRENSCLYISNCYALINVDWDDKDFIGEIKKTISPKISIPKHDIPKDRISVAVHVRKGGGYDEPLLKDPDANKRGQRFGYFADKVYPIKFPPDSYYIEQIRKMYELLDNVPLYVFIFTDDHTPKRIVEKFEKNLCDLDIVFSCRGSGNHHDKNVIEDFFGMTQYDCLIRNGSHFSFFADVIGEFKVVIYPEDAYWKDGEIVIDNVKVKINKSCYARISSNT
ncbi:hypothetical protein ACFLYA_00720 [Candidatus Dependentiae bacterium]